MLHPKPWHLEVAGSRAGPPRQDSGGDPDRSQSHTGLAQPRRPDGSVPGALTRSLGSRRDFPPMVLALGQVPRPP